MAELLKHVYSKFFFEMLSKQIQAEILDFNEKQFMKEIFSKEWESYELKQRMTHIAKVLRNHLHKDYPSALNQICSIIDRHKREHPNGFNFEFMLFPEFVQLFGLDDFKNSVLAIEKITQFTSCEFVVRHFIVKFPDEMILQMQNWANHEHHYVRRLASEGMRTRLPWAIGVRVLKENPKHILPILERLITDESDWVRKSVSNSLNDLSKDYPLLVIDFTKKWINKTEKIDKALKHACRTFLKQGNLEVLNLFGVNSSAKIELLEIKCAKKVQMGETLEFQFSVENKEQSDVFIRLEYKIYFLRQNGIHNSKVFKISEKTLSFASKIEVKKLHSFKAISTRKYYPGKQKIAFIVNGKESESFEFLLM
ncbi:MAG: DNA alkylation repair protein [Bacteroidota bacterium]